MQSANSMHRISFVTVGLFLLTGMAVADDWIRQGDETLKLSLGWFLPSFSTEVKVNNKNVDGGNGANLEDALGLDNSTSTAWGDLEWRFAERHRISVGYFSTTRDSTITTEENVEIGEGNTIPVGASAYTEFKLSAIPIAYEYSFIKNDRHELSGSAGLHWYRIEFSVDATAWLDDATGSDDVSVSADAPMPLFGLRYDYHVSDRWSVSLLGEIFAIDLDSSSTAFSGRVYNARIATEYWVSKHVGIGGAVNAFGLDVDVEDDNWKGGLEYDYWGPQLYVMGRY